MSGPNMIQLTFYSDIFFMLLPGANLQYVFLIINMTIGITMFNLYRYQITLQQLKYHQQLDYDQVHHRLQLNQLILTQI